MGNTPFFDLGRKLPTRLSGAFLSGRYLLGRPRRGCAFGLVLIQLGIRTLVETFGATKDGRAAHTHDFRHLSSCVGNLWD